MAPEALDATLYLNSEPLILTVPPWEPIAPPWTAVLDSKYESKIEISPDWLPTAPANGALFSMNLDPAIIISFWPVAAIAPTYEVAVLLMNSEL